MSGPKLSVIETNPTRIAQIMAMNNLIPICNYQPCPTMPGLWKGEVVPNSTQAKMIPLPKGGLVFFSRLSPTVNEGDKFLVEMEVTDSDLLGMPFILIPKEKCLFLYAPPSTIILAGSIFDAPGPKMKGRQ